MSTREKLTLVERMEAARARTVAARRAAPAPGPGLVQPVQPAPAAPPRAIPAPPPGAPTGSYWQLGARPGEDVFLMPGQLHFGQQAGSIKTLLGSCVAVTLWHPTKRLGGMCHFLLPSRTRSGGDTLDGRYGDEALETLLEHIRRSRTAPEEYHAHLYGGADTLPEGTNLRFNVGERNIEAGWHFVDRWGFQLQGVDVGEDVPRSVTLTLATGEVEIRRGQGRPPPVRLPPYGLLSGAPGADNKRN